MLLGGRKNWNCLLVRVKLLVDMNLSPEWVRLFRQSGFDAIHWFDIGRATAADEEVCGRS